MPQTILALLLAGAAPVSIYVGPVVNDGFVETDKGVQDSIRDTQRELRKVKGVRVVTSEADASISLYIVRRMKGSLSGGVGVAVAPGLTVLAGTDARTVEAVLRFGDYRRTFLADDHDTDAWSECAETLAKDVRVWLEANRERVRAQAPLGVIK